MWALSFRYSYQNPVCISIFPHNVTICAYLILLDLLTQTYFMRSTDHEAQFSSVLCHCLLPWPKYFPEHHIFQHPQSMFSLYCARPKFHTHIKIAGKIICIYVCVCVCVYIYIYVYRVSQKLRSIFQLMPSQKRHIHMGPVCNSSGVMSF